MLITLHLKDKTYYLYKKFKTMWNDCVVECQICFDRIENDGVIAVTDYKTLNIEKMFHASCIQRWRNENARDPFNRNVKFWFNFPPKCLEECAALLERIKGFIGDETADKCYAAEYSRVQSEEEIDIDVDFESLLSYET
jgi:hypothetical protein